MNQNLESAIQRIFQQSQFSFGDNDKQFVSRIFDDGLKKYSDRLHRIGFSSNKRILDAGCGFGQWSLALSKTNTFIDACDVEDNRLDFLSRFKDELSIGNIEVKKSGLEKLPYEDNCFDAIFCYGVLFVTDWKQSLREFSRVLKTGGKIYFTANQIGWYIYLWNENYNAAEDYDPREAAAEVLNNTLKYEKGMSWGRNGLIIDKSAAQKTLTELGFKDIIFDAEGHLNVTDKKLEPQPFFRSSYYDLPGTYECIATL